MSKYRKSFVKGPVMDENQVEENVTQPTQEVEQVQEAAVEVAEQQQVAAPIKASVVPTYVPKAAPVAAVVVAPAAAPVVEKLIVKQEDNSFEAKINRLRETGTTAQKALINKMDAYFEQMKPGKPVNPVTGGSHQLAFYMALRQICETETTEFKSVFTLLLEYFRQHKDGALGDRHVFRFVENIKMSNAAMRPFLGLINLLRVASEVKSREQVVKQVDLTRSLETGFSEQARQRIIQFFHV